MVKSVADGQRKGNKRTVVWGEGRDFLPMKGLGGGRWR